MSLTAMVWAMDQYDLIPGEKLTLLMLANHAGGEGNDLIAWPGVRHLAQKTNQTEQTVRNQLRGLVVKGLIEVRQRFREDGSQTTNEYRLLIGNQAATPSSDTPPAPNMNNAPPQASISPIRNMKQSVEPKDPATSGRVRFDARSVVFTLGVPYFESSGIPESRARSFLGKCVSTSGDKKTAAALVEAIANSALDPPGYITRLLHPESGPRRFVA